MAKHNYEARVSGVTTRTVSVVAKSQEEAERLAAQEFTALVGADEVLEIVMEADHWGADGMQYPT